MFSASSGYRYCCGHREIGSFDDGEFESTTAAGLLEKLASSDSSGTVFSIWFAKDKLWDGGYVQEYDYQEVRELVQQIPGVIHLGEHINPNTNNMIDGYLWVNP